MKMTKKQLVYEINKLADEYGFERVTTRPKKSILMEILESYQEDATDINIANARQAEGEFMPMDPLEDLNLCQRTSLFLVTVTVCAVAAWIIYVVSS